MFKKLTTRLLKPRMLFLVPEIEESNNIEPLQIVIRILVSLITVSWIIFLPYYLFIIYMQANNFFSYDFFAEGVFGLNTFVIASAIILVFLSLFLYGFVIILKLGVINEKRKGENKHRFVFWVSFIVSMLMHIILFIIFLGQEKLYVMGVIMGISIIFCSFFYSYVGHGFKKNLTNWLSPVLFVAVSILFPLMSQSATSGVVEIGLRSFNMGARNISIETISKSKIIEVTGNLLLLSPKNAYIKDKDNSLIIVPVSEHTKIKIW